MQHTFHFFFFPVRHTPHSVCGQVAQLKKALVERGLPTNGLKAELAARLMGAMGY